MSIIIKLKNKNISKTQENIIQNRYKCPLSYNPMTRRYDSQKYKG